MDAGWLLLLPLLLLLSCLPQEAQLQTLATGAEILQQDDTYTGPPVTTFLPDKELDDNLKKIIEERLESDKKGNYSYEKAEGLTERTVNNKTNINNSTESSSEIPTANVNNSSSTNISSSQPNVTTTFTEGHNYKLVLPLTEKPNETPVTEKPNETPVTEKPDETPVTEKPNETPETEKPDNTPVSASVSEITKAIEIDLISSTETTAVSSEISPVTYPIPPTESNIEYTGSSEPPMPISIVKKQRPPAWVSKIARPIIFPLFLAISWLFLAFLLVFHITVPKLRENAPFMGYIVALMLKATVTFCNIVFKHHHSIEFCFYAAAISYLKSLAMLFWVNIMVFDIWRKSRSLVQFKPSRPVPMWKYHLYGWGTPISLGLLSLLIELFVPDEATWIIKPGFDNGYKCWFEDDEAQLLYLNTPVGILHISNVILMVFTYRYVSRITDNAFIDDDQGAPGSTLPRDIAVPAAKRSDFISEFWFHFWILTFTVVQWVLWMIAQILQHFTGAWQLKVIPGFLIALQGVILFIIFISNSGKRRILKQHFPGIYERISGCWSKVQKSQNKLNISKTSAISADVASEPQSVVGQSNPAFVEEENNISYIALGNIKQN